MTEISKTELRRQSREKRLTLADKSFPAALARHAESLNIPKGAVVGAYHALPDEADPALLVARLVELGCRAAYPRVVGKSLPLDFHTVPDGKVLAPGAYGIREPLDTWPRAVPDILLVPLLAFDAKGYRLGYGGGFYDRTLFELQKGALLKVPAIGIAYAGQELASLPREAHDMALAAIVTENGIRRFE